MSASFVAPRRWEMYKRNQKTASISTYPTLYIKNMSFSELSTFLEARALWVFVPAKKTSFKTLKTSVKTLVENIEGNVKLNHKRG